MKINNYDDILYQLTDSALVLVIDWGIERPESDTKRVKMGFETSLLSLKLEKKHFISLLGMEIHNLLVR